MVTLLKIFMSAAIASTNCLDGMSQLHPRSQSIYELATWNGALEAARKEISRRLRNPEAEFARLHAKAPMVREVLVDVGHDPGAASAGVFRVKTNHGTMILKIVLSSPDPDKIVNKLTVTKSLVIQDALSQLSGYSLSPDVYGVLTEVEVKTVMERSELLKDYKDPLGRTPIFGVLMQEIPNSWAPVRSFRKPFEWSPSQVGRVLAQLEAIKVILDKIGLEARDLNPLIDADGRVYLIDFDEAVLLAESLRAKVKNNIETATQQILTVHGH